MINDEHIFLNIIETVYDFFIRFMTSLFSFRHFHSFLDSLYIFSYLSMICLFISNVESEVRLNK